MSAAPVLPHRDAILLLLEAHPHLSVFEGEVPATPPLGGDDRVSPYAVFYPGAGRPVVSSLCGGAEDLAWQFTVLACGGDVERCLLARDWVVGLLVDVEPVITGRTSWRVRLDHDLGPPRRFDDPLPPRFSLALLFTLYTSPS